MAALEGRNTELEQQLFRITSSVDFDLEELKEGSADDRIIAAFTRVQELQEENRALREAARRRDVVG